MKEIHLFYAPDIEQTLELPTDEAAHAIRVLRMKEGQEIVVADGKGYFYNCIITTVLGKHCGVEIISKITAETLWTGKINIAVSPTKNNDRMEWFAEKATEIGVDSIHFLCCSNSERKVIKTERIEKIVVSAAKQSHKALLPVVHPIESFKTFIKKNIGGQKFIAHCYDEILGIDNYKPFLSDLLKKEGEAMVLIGPEGDFSVEEVKMAVNAGFIPISLGKSRLRTETAALVSVHLMYLAKQV